MPLIDRAKNIVLAPKTEWEVIAPEVTDTGSLYRGYVIPLAAITPIAHFLGMSLIGVSVPFAGTIRIPFVWAFSQAVVSYVLSLIGVFIIGLIIDGLAPSFGGQKNKMQALKVAAYSFTPAWLAGMLGLVPSLAVLGILAGLYSLYVLYLGLPVLMNSAREKAVGYTAVVVICSIVVMVVVGAVAAAVGHFGMGGNPYLGGLNTGANNALINQQAGANVAAQVAAQMAAAANQMQGTQTSTATTTGNGQAQQAATAGVAGAAGALAALGGGTNVPSVDQNELKALLPDTFAGMPRTSFSASKTGIANMQVSKAEGQYSNGQGSSVTLSITDAAAARMLTAWTMMNIDEETDDGYTKMSTVDGLPVMEKVSKSSASAEYTTLIAGRFLVAAEGSHVDIATVKQGVAALDLSKLASLK